MTAIFFRGEVKKIWLYAYIQAGKSTLKEIWKMKKYSISSLLFGIIYWVKPGLIPTIIPFFPFFWLDPKEPKDQDFPILGICSATGSLGMSKAPAAQTRRRLAGKSSRPTLTKYKCKKWRILQIVVIRFKRPNFTYCWTFFEEKLLPNLINQNSNS